MILQSHWLCSWFSNETISFPSPDLCSVGTSSCEAQLPILGMTHCFLLFSSLSRSYFLKEGFLEIPYMIIHFLPLMAKEIIFLTYSYAVSPFCKFHKEGTISVLFTVVFSEPGTRHAGWVCQIVFPKGGHSKISHPKCSPRILLQYSPIKRWSQIPLLLNLVSSVIHW